MSKETKDPFAHLPRRNLFADDGEGPSFSIDRDIADVRFFDVQAIKWSEPSGVVLMPSDKSDEAADERFAREGSLRVLDPVAAAVPDDAPIESAKRGRGRPKVASGYPGPDCGLSRAQWYRRRQEASR